MTQQEKQLLLKDLCARLPYSVWGLHRGEDLPLYVIDNSGAYMVLGYNAWFDLDTIPFKPYLRPMSSMTEEEIDRMWEIYDSGPAAESSAAVTDYLYGRYLDCHHLIEIGLALKVKEGMYKIE